MLFSLRPFPRPVPIHRRSVNFQQSRDLFTASIQTTRSLLLTRRFFLDCQIEFASEFHSVDDERQRPFDTNLGRA